MATGNSQSLKDSRKALKGVLTRRINRIKQLITVDPCTSNVAQVSAHEKSMDTALENFRKAHNAYQATLVDADEIHNSFKYFDERLVEYYDVKRQMNIWIADTVRPNDSISNVSTSISKTSKDSSSIRAERMKTTAKRAALLVEAASLSKRYTLAEEKLRLQQMEDRLRIETNLEKVNAEDQVYEEFQREHQRRSSSYSGHTDTQQFPLKESSISQIEKCEPFTSSPFARRTYVKDESLPYDAIPTPHLQYYERPQMSKEFDDDNDDGFANDTKDSQSVLKSLQVFQSQVERQLKAQRLPKADLTHFDGNPLNYFLFMKSFENNVEKCTDDPSERLQLLIQYCSGKAKDVITSCGMMEPDKGYRTAKNLLEKRFGDRYLVSNAWISKIADGPPISANDRESLQDLADDLENCRIVLDVAGRLSEINNDDKLIKILHRVPSYLRSRWQGKAREIRDQGKVPNIEHLKELIANAAKEKNDPVFGGILDRPKDKASYKTATAGPGKRPIFSTQVSDQTYSTSPASQPPSRWKCFYCQASHRLNDCKDFESIPSKDQLQFVRLKKLCENCLSSTHFAGGCKLYNGCKVQDCTFSRKHLAILHPALIALRQEKRSPSTDSQPSASMQANARPASGFTGTLSSSINREVTALPIIPVKVKSHGNGKTLLTYALLDSGSTSTWCSERLLVELEAVGTDTEICITTIERKDVLIETKRISLEVLDLDEDVMVELPEVYTRKDLHVSSNNIPCQEDVNRWPHLQEVHLPHINAKVELLIGQDVPTALEPLEVKRSTNGGPYATKTCLGWTLNGPLGRKGLSKKRQVLFSEHDELLHEQFTKFVNLEFIDSIACEKQSMSQDDRRAMKIYDNSVSMIDGHYQIAIPWKSESPGLPNNKPLAEHRLRLLNRKLLKDEVLLEKYSKFMDDLLEKNFARKIPDDRLSRDDGKVWYLPHHSVTNPQKPDKVRVVLDCAAKYQDVSLNSVILQGPDLTSKLIGVLTRFREESCCLMSDVESMYYQVRVSPDDVDALRFLWYPNNDPNQEPVEYQMLVHPFGGVWSASCANYALLRTATDNARNYNPQVVKTVEENFYVDDCLKSVDSEEKAISLSQDLSSLLACGGFHLTKWLSNSRKVICSIPAHERAKEIKDLDLNQEHLPIERALGVKWNMEADKFIIQIKPKEKPATRRGILSTVSSVYDPLGFVCPFVLSSKSILRDLCSLGWDDAIPDRQLTRWNEWLSDLPKLECFSLDRCFKSTNFGNVLRSRLHHFADASEVGYAAVSYIRQENDEGEINCAFVLGKSRIAPLKQVSIPRLELSAATVAVRLDLMLRREIDIQLDKSMFWTDSTAVLGYIDNQDKRYQTFVANRLSFIRDVSSPDQWMHIDGKSNPADIASRGASAENLLHNVQWFRGPDFLWNPEQTWPSQPDVKRKIPVDDPELKTKTVLHLTVDSSSASATLDRLFHRFSSWNKLKKSVAWILRYKKWLVYKVKMKSRPQTYSFPDKGRITTDEMQKAEHEILSCVQKQFFKEEIDVIAEGNIAGTTSSVKKSSVICSLDPVVCDGLLRVGGRLRNAQLDYNARHPIILPKHHPIVDLLIRHYHLVSGHSGQEHVLSLIRERYWIIRGRVSVRKFLRSCFDCKRRQQRPAQQKMADLPSDRVTPGKPPFTCTGIDCFGPFEVKRGRSYVKRYGVIFTCLAIRAIHIEVAHSLDTSSFICSLRRFISRRGIPEEIRSDNGGNFKGGEKELRQAIEQWNREQIHEFMLQRNIRWIFNPPFASHMGGVWERCIRTVRKVLSALVKEQVLDDEGLSTLMCEAESIVNSRPLTKVSDDPKDMEALSPNHLLLLRQGPSLPPGSFAKHDVYSAKRWRQVQYMSDVFWRRWVKEYLPSLQQRIKWQRPKRNLLIGDLVLLVDNSSPRCSWPMGRILEIMQNKDGHVRQVKLKTKTTVLSRPIHKLCLLENV